MTGVHADGNGNGRPGRPLQSAASVLWPSFMAASLAELVLVALVDPAALHMPGGEPVARTAAYTVGFFAFWAICAVSSAVTLYLARELDASDAER